MKSRSLVFLALMLSIACRKETPASSATATQTTAAPTATTTAAATAPEDLTGKKVDTTVPAPPKVVPQCIAGSQLGNSGGVTKPSSTFGPNEPIYFTMWLDQAPPGLQVSVKVLDADGKEVATVPKAAEGLKLATLTIPRPAKKGKYKLEGYWGGNVVCEAGVEVK